MFYGPFNPLDSKGNCSATSNNTKLVHWPLMGGLLDLVQRGGDWAGPEPAQSPPRCKKGILCHLKAFSRTQYVPRADRYAAAVYR